MPNNLSILTSGNTEYEIRDIKLVEHTSASTSSSDVASGNSIMLETVSGDVVSVKRDSFVNAIRDVLGASIKANVGGTSAIDTVPALGASGELKSVSTADLASVLSESQYMKSIFVPWNGATYKVTTDTVVLFVEAYAYDVGFPKKYTYFISRTTVSEVKIGSEINNGGVFKIYKVDDGYIFEDGVNALAFINIIPYMYPITSITRISSIPSDATLIYSKTS